MNPAPARPDYARIETAAASAYRSRFPNSASDRRLRAVIDETLAASGGLTRLKLGLLAGEVLGLPEARATDMATAMEYFHTASLLVDDLPCMDDAVERRGQACAHRKHGEESAILGALAFINRAYALLWSSFSAFSPRLRDRAAAIAERCLGDAGILDGQANDLHFRFSDGSPRTVARVAMGKTVTMLRLTLLTPALLADAGSVELRLLDRISVYWGLAYQVADDCADLFARNSGKTHGRDALLGHANFALAAGSVATVRRLGRLLRQLEATLTSLVRIRPGWQALDPLVTKLVRSSRDAKSANAACDRQCA